MDVYNTKSPNGLSIVKGEIANVVAILRRVYRSYTYQEEIQDTLVKNFHLLKEKLASIKYLEEIDGVTYLTPFLDVIRSESTTGPITGVALNTVNKILCYNLLDVTHPACVTAVEAIADAVTHARFVGTDPANDEVVLMKILQVLKSLMLSKVGVLLNNESVCEVMQSCFRICFETRLSELLRRTAEQTLIDITHLMFLRLPEFKDQDESVLVNSSIRKALKRGLHVNTDKSRARKKRNKKAKASEKSSSDKPRQTKSEHSEQLPPVDKTETEQQLDSKNTEQTLPADLKEQPNKEGGEKGSADPVSITSDHGSGDPGSCEQVALETNSSEQTTEIKSLSGGAADSVDVQDSVSVVDDTTSQVDSLVDNEIGNVLIDKKSTKGEDQAEPAEQDFTNSRGIKFTQSDEEEQEPSPPYGLACLRELFSFLACITNPVDTNNNGDMVSIGLSLLTVAIETGGQNIAKYKCLLKLCQNEVARALFRLVQSDSLHKTVTALRICNFLVENLRSHLKLQIEKYFNILMDIVIADTNKGQTGQYEKRELALEALVHLCRLPGLIPELYLNYDCHNYCSNIYEDLTKALSKNAFPVSGLNVSHILSLDALLAVVNVIALQCEEEQVCGDQMSSVDGETSLPSYEELIQFKDFKNKLVTGSLMFNENPSDGIKYLLNEGVLKASEPAALAKFVFTNLHLNKATIGEYLGKKKNETILQEFIKNFDFVNLKIHDALRIFLESFRLPGEAQIIERIMTYFAEHWIETAGSATNGIANTDSAFILSYAIIILNVDQHNKNTTTRKMDLAAFQRNQRGLNNGMDYPAEMLDDIFKSISENEIKMPDEHAGELKESYRWKTMLRRQDDAVYYLCGTVSTYNRTLFSLIWGPTVAALSFVFDTALEDDITEKTINGFYKCASISAHYGLSDVFDNLIISLCNFTGLLSSGETPEEKTVHFGSNTKSRLTARTMFTLAHTHGDILREGWKNILECILQLYKSNLMPNSLYQAFDFVQGHVHIQLEERIPAKQDQGLFSSIFSLLNADTSGRGPTTQDLEAQKQAKACIQECQPQKLFTDSKYLQGESLADLVQWLIQFSSGPHVHAKNKTDYSEYTSAVFIELLATVILENRSRIDRLWGAVQNHLNSIISPATSQTFLVERSIVTLLRLAVRMVGRINTSDEILHSIIILLLLRPNLALKNSVSICYGLFDLVKESLGSEISYENWKIIFALLEMAGAGVKPPTVIVKHIAAGKSDTTLVPCATSETDITKVSLAESILHSDDHSFDEISVTQREEETEEGEGKSVEEKIMMPEAMTSAPPPSEDISQWTIEYVEDEKPGHQLEIGLANTYFDHNPLALGKACETLSLIIRDNSVVRSDNFNLCVHAVRVLAEAYSSGYKADKDKDNITGLIQLLDLMHTLHTRALSIFKPPSVEGQRVPLTDTSLQPIVGEVWLRCWCPLLQGIGRVCCDVRKDVRQAGLTYLQRALLAHDLRALAAVEWEACFRQVMFPLLAKLLEKITPDVMALEETRMRAATLLCKAFLQHLSPLLALPGFTDLWIDILDFMDRYINSGSSDLLSEAIPENLKNMLLVMSNGGVFEEDDNHYNERKRQAEPPHKDMTSSLWITTWSRVDKFLPNLKTEMFPPESPKPVSTPAAPPTEGGGKSEERTGSTNPALQAPTVVPPPLPPDLQNLMSSVPQLVSTKPGVKLMTPEQQQKVQSAEGTAPVSVEPLYSYLS